MKKVAVFTEGQSELIFIRHFILNFWGYENVSFECFELYTDQLQVIPYRYFPQEPKIHFQIVNVGNDERVLAVILERRARLIASGFEIIGLRDMYSNAYRKWANQIDPQITQAFLDYAKNIIDENSNPGELSLFYAIMELESWLLGLDNLFLKLDPRLTSEFIAENLGYDLTAIDPEITFFHPTVNLNKIFGLIEQCYNKSKDQMEGILALVEPEDFLQLAESGKCNSFRIFFEKISRL